jgi:ABC-type antimicrobial peptide transport system permease subunit
MQYARDSFEQALLALHDHRLRTFLSVLGVAVGVAAVVTVGTVTKSGRDYLFAQLETFGLSNIWIWRDVQTDSPFRVMTPGSGITSEDLDALVSSGCCPNVAKFSPRVYFEPRDVWVRSPFAFARLVVEGVNEHFIDLDRGELAVGRDLREEDVKQRKLVAVIGPKAQARLFGPNSNPLGQSLRIHDLRFTVVGVLKEKDRSFLMKIGVVTWDDNERILIPYTVYQQILGSKDVHTLQAQANTVEAVAIATSELVHYLQRRNGTKMRYVDDNMLRWVENANMYLQRISFIGAVAAALSLLVGGIGIMNIMSTSVLERTREIGIRKAIGARYRDILTQFLLEAACISLLGGAVGLVLGTGASYVLSLWAGLPLLPSPMIILVALVVATGVGIISGYYPARRAARMKPVDALRYD